jgi:hypothetical protein
LVACVNDVHQWCASLMCVSDVGVIGVGVLPAQKAAHGVALSALVAAHPMAEQSPWLGVLCCWASICEGLQHQSTVVVALCVCGAREV